MSSSKNVVPEAKEALNRFKMEAASEVRVPKHLELQETPYLSHFSHIEKMALLMFQNIKNTKNYTKHNI